MSPKLAKFASELKKFKNTYGGGKMLSGIAWDKIPDSEVILKKSGDESIKNYVNNDEYIIIWFASTQQTIQYKPTTYSRYGSPRDNSTYLRPGQIIITQGRKFLYGYRELQNYKPAQDKYQEPYDGKLSVLKLSREMDANALILNQNALTKYSTVDLRQQRSSSKEGATALMKVSDILSKNKDRYRTLLKQGRDNAKTKPITDQVNQALNKLKLRIEQLSKIDFNDLVTYSPSTTSYYDKETPVPQVKQIDLTKLNEAAKLYGEIVQALGEYVRDIKQGYSYSERSENRVLSAIEKVNSI